MRLAVEPFTLATTDPFKISRSTRDTFELFAFSLSYKGYVGLGESSPQPFYGETPMTLRGAVNSLGSLLEGEPDDVRARLHTPGTPLGDALAAHPTVRAALDMALWDLRGKIDGVPCYQLFGADPANAPLTSFTIGFDTPDVIDRKVDAAEPYRILKVKVGLPGDMAVLDRVIARSGKTVRVDANEGWDTETAIVKTEELRGRGVEFVEQPIPHEDEEGLRTLKRVSALPVILDESIRDVSDVRRCHDQGHGINIKLMKCGGLTPALEMIRAARDLGLEVMLGCMLETSIGVTAAAHLSPLADYADLDGNLLLAEDPFVGVRVRDGRLVLPEGNGLGVTRATPE